MKVSFMGSPLSYIFAEPPISSSHTKSHLEAMESGRKSPDNKEMVSVRHADSEQNGRSCVPRGVSTAPSPELEGLLREARPEATFRNDHKFKAIEGIHGGLLSPAF